jgi:hypothetical protein
MDQVAVGDDYTSLATEFGYSSSEEAQIAYNLIVSAKTVINEYNYQIILSRMG